MKKLGIGILLTGLLSLSAFGATHHNEIKTTVMPKHNAKMVCPPYNKNREKERERILIDEKRLDIRKELLNENPDWKKIEKLNTEIAVQEAIIRTQNMKERYEKQANDSIPATKLVPAQRIQ